MVRSVIRLVLALGCLVAMAAPGAAQHAPQGERRGLPGQFDFYVLSLSWAPSFCAATAERTRDRYSRHSRRECGAHDYAFIVHGLWPQEEKGFPENCQVPAPRLNRAIVGSMLDLMPAPRLVFDEWDRHGTCSGLSPRNFFDTLRRARASVQIPPAYLDLHQPLSVAPAAVKDAFIKANPGLAPEDFAVICDAELLTEVRLCLSKELKFRTCPEVVAHSCRRVQVLMPPLH